MTGLPAPAPLDRPTEVRFVVRGQPIGQNAAWRIIAWKPKPGSGKAPHASLKLSDEGEAYKVEVNRIANLARPDGWDRDNQYLVEAVYFFRTTGSDCDGPGKLVLDALKDFDLSKRGKVTRHFGLFRDDSQVWRFTQQKEKDAIEPRAEITVRLRHPPRPEQHKLPIGA